jgi:hypothetical protein
MTVIAGHLTLRSTTRIASSRQSLLRHDLLGDLRPAVEGTVSLWLARRFAARADTLLDDLVKSALEIWESEGFSRFDDHEISCTVRLFASCRKVLVAEKRKFAQMSIYYDAAQPSDDMLTGKADPHRSARPDLTVTIGVSQLRLEAKLLTRRRTMARLYVSQGMARFLDGRYGSRGLPGVMIGYVLSGRPSELVAWINVALETELSRERDEVLVARGMAHPRMMTHDSLHEPDIRIVHHMIDLRQEAHIRPRRSPPRLGSIRA